MRIESHRDLLVWQKAIEFSKAVYTLTETFPKSEMYGLTSQLRRAANSIAINIAEGHGRGSRKDYCHFVSISFGSAMECDTLLHLAVELGLTSREKSSGVVAKLDEIGRMLNSLRAKLHRPAQPSSP